MKGHIQTAEIQLGAAMASFVTYLRVTAGANRAVKLRPSIMLDTASSAVRKVHCRVSRGSAGGTPTTSPPTAVLACKSHVGVDITGAFTIEHIFTAEPATPGVIQPPGVVPVNPSQNWWFDWTEIYNGDSLDIAVKNYGASPLPGCRFGFEFEVM